LAWFLAGVERAGLATPSRAEYGDGANVSAATFLLEALTLKEVHLVERARRELERVLGTALALPDGEDERAAFLFELRASIERKFPQ
jgi:hypothetical protein